MINESPVPFFPENRPLILEDKPLLDSLFASLQPRISEMTFAGLYLFRNAHGYRLTQLGDSLVVLGRGYDGAEYFMPPLSGGVSASLARLFAAGLQLYGADELFVSRYLLSMNLQLKEDRDSFDYLYLRKDLAELPGNRYHKKNNRINYFTKRYSFTVEVYQEGHLSACLALLAEWQRVRGEGGSRSLTLESEATAEALRLASLLGIEGVVVHAGGRVVAFALGERLNDETSVCHFEKADPFIEGASQLVDREFNRLHFTGCTWVNREQDLGESGLRSAKLSYHPIELVKKYRASMVFD